VALFSPAARAQTTTWFGSTGNWGTAANWSNGEPTADLDAILTAAGTAQVTASGETCRNLFVGTVGGGPSVTISGGSLSVVHRMQVPRASSGIISQTLGAVSADSWCWARPRPSVSTRCRRHADGQSPVIGTSKTASTGSSRRTANPVLTVAHTLTIGRGANIVHSAARERRHASTDSVVVFGARDDQPPEHARHELRPARRGI
jgi:hypothetical protein